MMTSDAITIVVSGGLEHGLVFESQVLPRSVSAPSPAARSERYEGNLQDALGRVATSNSGNALTRALQATRFQVLKDFAAKFF
ncbi:hypothetical protein ElyMa_004832400 [Elysia marginata]|uniref:Uncharacterized protein n=1 Tax=Elysia marginata TaxID=1093978 RepID=A0AAV4IMG7_9GAST|nr:hypothetical protein ElyMa_004832400 [Elysia marginata]